MLRPNVLSGALFVAMLAAALLAAGLRRARRGAVGRRWRRRALGGGAAVSGLLALLLAVAAGCAYWYTHRGQPAAERRALFTGVDYERLVRQSPRPMVIHVVTIDLGAPGVSFLVTPRGETGGRVLTARKTSAFVEEFGLQLAVNANYFLPFRSESPWDYYPRAGDGVDLCGFAASRGDVYSDKRWRGGTLFIGRDNRASFERPVGEVYSAIAGNGFVLRDGEPCPPAGDDEPSVKPYPRAAVGLDAAARRMFFIVVDGKQPGYSEGATLAELGEVARALGVRDLARLDEGGSCALAVEERPGRAGLLNVPINNRIPYRERVVANHLGVFAGRPK